MASQSELQSAAQRASGQISAPIPIFLIEPLPPKILAAFPELKEWQTKTNQRIAEWTKTLNVLQGNLTSAVVALQP